MSKSEQKFMYALWWKERIAGAMPEPGLPPATANWGFMITKEEYDQLLAHIKSGKPGPPLVHITKKEETRPGQIVEQHISYNLSAPAVQRWGVDKLLYSELLDIENKENKTKSGLVLPKNFSAAGGDGFDPKLIV